MKYLAVCGLFVDIYDDRKAAERAAEQYLKACLDSIEPIDEDVQEQLDALAQKVVTIYELQSTQTVRINSPSIEVTSGGFLYGK